MSRPRGYAEPMTEDRSAAEWASRVLIGLAGVCLGLYVVGIGWAARAEYSQGLLADTPGWWLVIGGLAFAVGSGVWAFLPRPVSPGRDNA